MNSKCRTILQFSTLAFRITMAGKGMTLTEKHFCWAILNDLLQISAGYGMMDSHLELPNRWDGVWRGY
jgi:hypothetical protein